MFCLVYVIFLYRSFNFLMNNQVHPFHLVDPSPWPIVTATAAFGSTTGGVMFFHGYIGGQFLMSLSICFLFFMMFT